MKWKWTIKELLVAMFLISLIAAWYWNQQHGRMEFNRWTGVVTGVLVVPVLFYQFARNRQVIWLIAGIICTCYTLYFVWRISPWGV